MDPSQKARMKAVDFYPDNIALRNFQFQYMVKQPNFEYLLLKCKFTRDY